MRERKTRQLKRLQAASRTPRHKAPTQFDITCRKYQEALRSGLVLAVDPSIGSQKSMPGFALVEGGRVIHSGHIQIDASKPPHRRLHMLQTELFAITPAIDLLITENIPPFMNKGSGGFRNQSMISLHWAVGAILAAYDTDLIQVPISSWHSWVNKNVGDFATVYKKCDENDALAMTCACFAAAGIPLGNVADVIRILRGEDIGETEVL